MDEGTANTACSDGANSQHLVATSGSDEAHSGDEIFLDNSFAVCFINIFFGWFKCQLFSFSNRTLCSNSQPNNNNNNTISFQSTQPPLICQQPTNKPPPKDSTALRTLNREWAELQDELAHKERILNERDATIRRQQRRLDELNGMRTLMDTFRVALERLQGFEQYQQQQHNHQHHHLLKHPISSTHNNNRSLLNSSSSGFFSAESIPESRSLSTPPVDSYGGDRLMLVPVPPPPSSMQQQQQRDESGVDDGGVTLVAGIQRLLQDMCEQIAILSEQNVQLNETLNDLNGRDAKETNDAGSRDVTEVRQMFSDFIRDVANMVSVSGF